eukprot:scaffold15050_cov141-Isochrysis_galbana.AAC.1
MSPGQDRGVVCKAFESLVRKGLSVEEVARDFSPPLVFDASFASRGAEKARELELERLAAFSAGGGSLRLMCWCAPRQCHALSIAKVVAERAESACRLLSQLCLLVRRSLLSLGPGAEERSHYLGGGSLYGCPPERSFEQRMRREHEFKRGLSGSSQRSREQTQNKNYIVNPTALPSPSSSV